MKAEVLKWQSTPELMLQSPLLTPHPDVTPAPGVGQQTQPLELGQGVQSPNNMPRPGSGIGRTTSLDKIPLLDDSVGTTTGLDGGAKDIARERKTQ